MDRREYTDRDDLSFREEVLSLVRHTVESYTLYREVPASPSPHHEGLRERAGAFVSIKKKDSLRGCIGTIRPTASSLAEEIISNAIGAATKDPRFSPIEAEELPELQYSVDILGGLEEVRREDLDPEVYGLLVEKGKRRGLLLPALKDINTVEDQIEIACKKAGIHSLKGVRYYRFTVDRYRE